MITTKTSTFEIMGTVTSLHTNSNGYTRQVVTVTVLKSSVGTFQSEN